ncbi:MAG: LON peptidase substrate-binding domain-containing protein [Planctomycetes bacterium]|nr:LON peptidase substrate-binding domain-containing protein [Planctomycetota bacterium]
MGLFLPNQFEVPLFPLPDAVLFPGMVMPLHIFEPRYRKLLADALAGEKLIAMARLKAGWQSEYLGRPPIHEIVGVGRVGANQELADGTSNIALIGIARCQVREDLARDLPYRLAGVMLLKDRPLKGPEIQKQAKAARDALCAVAGELIRKTMNAEAREVMARSLEERQEAGQAADFLASVFVLDPDVRQGLLENLEPLDRCRRVLALVTQLAQGREPEGPPSTGKLDEYSLN